MNASALGPVGRRLFASIDTVFELSGEQITRDRISDVVRVEADGKRYFVKRYVSAGKNLRRWFGKPRVAAEWSNLHAFAAWGIPTAVVVAQGLERRFGFFHRGAMVTEEIAGTIDLVALSRASAERHGHRELVTQVSAKVAAIARTLHDQGFAHNDFHWRNLLYQEASGEVFLIDCPAGRRWHGPMLRYRIAKDLAALDRTASDRLSRTGRLRFYLQYAGKDRLDASAKDAIRYIVRVSNHRQRRKHLPLST